MDRLSCLEALGRQIADEQDASLAGAPARDDARSEFLALAERAHRPRGRVWAAVAGTAAAAAVLAFIFARADSGPLSVVAGEQGNPVASGDFVAAPAQGKLPLIFSDGTRVELEREARARVLSLDPLEPEIVLESGKARAEVNHREGVSWHVRSGPFTVKVTGTRFTSEWDPVHDSFELVLEEGSVLVSGCLFGEPGRPLLAGETLRASCSAGWFEVVQRRAPSVAPEVGPSGSIRPEASASVPTPPSGAAAPRVSEPSGAAGGWRELARKGKYADAYATAREFGFAEECDRVSAIDLALLADVARYAGQGGEAREAYTTLRRRFPGTPQAATAAYSLGRMAFDGSAAYGEAARWFQLYLAEQPGGPLAREALGRLMEAQHRTGNESGARRLARQYLSTYPNGPHARLARELTAKAPEKSRPAR